MTKFEEKGKYKYYDENINSFEIFTLMRRLSILVYFQGDLCYSSPFWITIGRF